MEYKPSANVGDDAEARHRFHSFKLGNGFPSSFNTHKPPHSRSHSRNISLSSPSSLSIPLSTTLPDEGLTPSTRRNSHHRRRSSVSTRRESAEMMGIALPDTEDSSKLREKDSIRRRTLWALEGKPDVYSKVEIPELSTPQMEKIMSEFPSMPSFSQSPGMISSKRDSFKLLSSASSTKDHLHTLVEEEEEEEEEGPSSSPVGPKATEHLAILQPAHGSSLTVKPTMNRPRPASLNLRPLSLTPEAISISVAQPQPTFSRSTVRSGLKSLSLSSSVTCEQSSSLLSCHGSRSQSFTSPLRSSNDCATPSAENSKPRRRSNIPYKTSSDVAINCAGLPTPGMTPNYQEQHFSWSESLKNSSEDDFFLPSPAKKRPLSASEQCFLVKSYGTLLVRIAELERALSARISPSYSRASISSDISFSSDQTGTTLGESSDEVLQLITDLKLERDEYKKDIDAWRVTVHDMDNKIAMMAKRVEVERREAWLARSRVSLLEAEKASLEKKLECSEVTLTMVHGEKNALEVKNQELRDEMEQVHADLIQVRQLLGQAQQEIKDVKRLKIVASDLTDEDDAFAQYDEESDISFRTSSSISIDEPPSSGVLFALNYLASDVQNAVEAVQGHASKDSLSKSWTFPTGAQTVIEPCKSEAEVDDFFGCLDVVEDEANALLYTDPSEYSYERSKGLFSEALKSFCDDQNAPFFPGIVSISEDGMKTVAGSGKLSAVLEDEEHLASENDKGMLGEANGICITLTPAQDDDDECEDDGFVTSPSDPPVLPPLNFDDNVEELHHALSLNFSCYDISEMLAADSQSPTPKVTSACSSSIALPDSALGPSIFPVVVPKPNHVSPQFSTSTHGFQLMQRWSTDICTPTNLPNFVNEHHATKVQRISAPDDPASVSTRRMPFTNTEYIRNSGKSSDPHSGATIRLPLGSSDACWLTSRPALPNFTTFILSLTHQMFSIKPTPKGSSKLQLQTEGLLEMKHLDSHCQNCHGKLVLL